jgi:hypothetical protein
LTAAAAQAENLRKLVVKGMAVMLPNSAAVRKNANSTFERQQVADTIQQVCKPYRLATARGLMLVVML